MSFVKHQKDEKWHTEFDRPDPLKECTLTILTEKLTKAFVTFVENLMHKFKDDKQKKHKQESFHSRLYRQL